MITSSSFINHVTFIGGYDAGVVQFALIFAPGAIFCTSVLNTGASSGISTKIKLENSISIHLKLYYVQLYTNSVNCVVL